MRKCILKNKYKLAFFLMLVLFLSIGIGYSAIFTQIELVGIATIEAYKQPIIQEAKSYDSSTFRFYKEEIKTLTFGTEINIPSNAIESWDVGVAQNGNVMAYIVANTTDSNMYDLFIQGDGELYANPNSQYFLMDFRNLETINNIELLNTSKVEDMSFMFSGIEGVENLDLSSFDTSNVTDMGYMFYRTYNLKTLNTTGWNTSKVTDMTSMFEEAESIQSLQLNHWDTSSVKGMSFMFYRNYELSHLEISSWKTHNVTNMSYMFNSVLSIQSLDLSGWNIQNVKNMAYMFSWFGEEHSSATIIINNTPFNSSVNFNGLFSSNSIPITMTVNSEADKILIDNLGYSNVTVIVG